MRWAGDMAVGLWSAPCAELEGGWSRPLIVPWGLEPQGGLAGVVEVEDLQLLKTWEVLVCAVQL